MLKKNLDFNELIDNSNKTRALIKKGFSAYSNKQYREAVKYYDKALEIEPTNILALSDNCSSLKKLGRYEDAKDCHELMKKAYDPF